MPNVMTPGGVTIAVVLATGLLAGCAGRMANPAQEATIYDRYMTCEQIRAEVARNYDAQSALVREKVQAEEENDLITASSFLYPPGFFALDNTVAGDDYGTAPQEVDHAALAARVRYLVALAKAKSPTCWPGDSHWVQS